jgi:hypothetical protein
MAENSYGIFEILYNIQKTDWEIELAGEDYGLRRY